MSTAQEVLDRKTIVAGSVGLGIASVLTIVRLAIRFSLRKRLVWDDALAILATLLLVTTGVATYYTINTSQSISHQTRIASSYLGIILYDLTVWTSRLSVLATVLMFGYYIRYIQVAVGLFCVVIVILVAQVLVVCEQEDRHNHWKSAAYPLCGLDSGMVISRVATDAFADVVLVLAPLLILRKIKWEPTGGECLRLRVSFAVGGLTTIVSSVQAYYALKGDPISIIAGTAKLSVSVIICNFPVLAAALHRVIRRCYLPTDAAPVGFEEHTINFALDSRALSESGQQMMSRGSNIVTTPMDLESGPDPSTR